MRRLSFSIFLLAPVFLTGAGPEPKPSLETAYRRWDRGLRSADPEEQRKALRDMLPNREVIAHLFPKDVEKLWPLFEKGQRLGEENISKLAQEFARRGEIRDIQPIDARKDDRRASGKYKRLFAMIPADVPVFTLVVVGEKGSGGSSSYVYHQGRWFWIQGLEGIPGFLEKR